MPRYEVTRTYLTNQVAKVNANTYEEAYGRAVSQGYWKTYDGPYRPYIDIVEIEEDDDEQIYSNTICSGSRYSLTHTITRRITNAD